ncbi:hypothetical protein M0R45_010053 [Rubus argutus]|uniref:Disease resistance protein Roq1-like winged-helix domain-containing protein n=1 Tax=Rubus argutus TaxID=59490 RepID=A0AAW1Y8F2_RUBAR
MGTQLSRVEVTGIQELCASSPLVGGSTALSVLSSPSCASGMPVVDRATCSCSFASEGRMQTNSSPLTSRSSEKLGSGWTGESLDSARAKRDHPIPSYWDHSKRLINHGGGLPLALRVLGSSLSGKNIAAWDSALNKLEAIPNGEILKKLKISYDSLQDDHDQNLFLHIACFFIGMEKDVIVGILDDCDFFTEVGIQSLIDRCLVTVDEYNKVQMHDMIRDMGRGIVRLESKKPGERSRLWHHKDSFQVLTENNGTQTIEGLVLNMHMLPAFAPSRNSNTVVLEIKAFTRMPKLRFLQLSHIQLSGCYEEFPKRLRWLCWIKSPLASLPTDFPFGSLVALEMCYSGLRQLWRGKMNLPSLKILNLSYSHDLTESRDFSSVPNLERLNIKDCLKSLVRLPGVSALLADNCTSLEKITYQSALHRPRSFGLHFDHKLVEIEGWHKLEPIDRVDEEMINLLSLSNLESLGSIMMGSALPYNPGWKGMHPVQGLYEDGLNVFSVIAKSNNDDSDPTIDTVNIDDSDHPVITVVSNKSKDLKWIYGPKFFGIPGDGKDMIWLSHWKFGNRLEGGDVVTILIYTKSEFKVKECGFQLVYHDQDQENINSTQPYTASDDPCFLRAGVSSTLDVYQIRGISFKCRAPGIYDNMDLIRDINEKTDREEGQQGELILTLAAKRGSNSNNNNSDPIDKEGRQGKLILMPAEQRGSNRNNGGLRGRKGLIIAFFFFLSVFSAILSNFFWREKQQATILIPS